ncbi:Uncharacterised protein [uncultured archaeon]|nr:Uncharacterised protein [uncultured archaeon]
MDFPHNDFWWQSSKALKNKAVEKVLHLKDKRYVALLLVEFVLAMAVVASIIFWLDYRYNVVEFPFNIIIFGLCIFAVLRFYSYTAQFRAEREMQRRTSFRIFLLEFLIFMILVSAAYIYQDRAINTLPYPYNFALFLVVLLPMVFIYINEKYLKPA